MSNDDVALNIDKNFKPQSGESRSPTDAFYFTARIKPALPSGVDEIIAEKLVYASFTEESLSVLGSTGTGPEFKQVGILLPIGIVDGRHDLGIVIGEPRASIIQSEHISGSRSGYVDFKRDTDKNIRGKAVFKILYRENEYDVSAEFSLAPTGEVP